MPTFLHISDLHRTAEPRLENDALLAAIASDAVRWAQEGIPRPDIIVVSGDLIQGTAIGTHDPDPIIAAQYAEATAFLTALAAELVDADRSRVIIVPGNHDVHWGRSLTAMNPLALCPERIATKALEPNSMLRWNWRDQTAYAIADIALYRSRFEHFRRFHAAFYAGLEPNPLSHGHEDLVFVEYPSLGVAVAGFASWHGNDCFCHIGEINNASLSASRQLIAGSTAPVVVAVWHHSIIGGPRSQDYMDQRVVEKLIDFGFNIGLHGHQHHPGAAPFQLNLPNLTAMAVVGAGSLAVGDGELPMGERRQFNIVDVDTDQERITVYVRAMSSGGVFAGSHRDDFGGHTFVRLLLPVLPSRRTIPTAVQRLNAALEAVRVGHYHDALALAAALDTSHEHEQRQIRIEALTRLDHKDELLALIDPPQSADETVRLVSLLLDARRFDAATARLNAASGLVGPSTYQDLAATIAARKMF